VGKQLFFKCECFQKAWELLPHVLFASGMFYGTWC
jgi:hypothetical protein